MPEPFGKLNRRVVVKPLAAKKRVQTQPTQAKSSAALYFYAAGAVLFLILAGYALAS